MALSAIQFWSSWSWTFEMNSFSMNLRSISWRLTLRYIIVGPYPRYVLFGIKLIGLLSLCICAISVTFVPITPLMSQHASSSSQTYSSRSIRRGEAVYTIPEGFPATSVQSALKVVRQYRRSEVSKGEAIFQIQSSLCSGEAEPSREDLTLTTYITMLNDLNRPAQEN